MRLKGWVNNTNNTILWKQKQIRFHTTTRQQNEVRGVFTTPGSAYPAQTVGWGLGCSSVCIFWKNTILCGRLSLEQARIGGGCGQILAQPVSKMLFRVSWGQRSLKPGKLDLHAQADPDMTNPSNGNVMSWIGFAEKGPGPCHNRWTTEWRSGRTLFFLSGPILTGLSVKCCQYRKKRSPLDLEAEFQHWPRVVLPLSKEMFLVEHTLAHSHYFKYRAESHHSEHLFCFVQFHTCRSTHVWRIQGKNLQKKTINFGWFSFSQMENKRWSWIQGRVFQGKNSKIVPKACFWLIWWKREWLVSDSGRSGPVCFGAVRRNYLGANFRD